MHFGAPRNRPGRQFLNERAYQVSDRARSSAIGVWAAVVFHLVLLLVMWRNTGSLRPAGTHQPPSTVSLFYVRQPKAVHGGGGSGGANRSKPTPATSPGRDSTTLRVATKSAVPVPGFNQSAALPAVQVPAMATAAGIQELPGVMAAAPALAVGSRGLGTGPAAGNENGDGSGLGRGPGLDAGQGGLEGGGPMHPGGDVSWPRLLRDSKPQYTADALRAHAQGLIELRVVVLADGSVGGVDIVRGFQPPFGLDDEAIKAVRRWRFEPARRAGRPIAVVVPVELSFTLR